MKSMKIKIEHAFAILLIGFLLATPMTAAAGYTVAQDEFGGEEFFQGLLTNGAEVMFSMIDDQGAPAAIYGQLGIPSEELDLESAMYDDCIAMAFVSVYGEFLDIVMEMIGGDLFGDNSSGGGFALAQDGGFDPNSIFDMIGTEFSLLVNVFVNVDEATSRSRMSSIVNNLQTQYQFSFIELFSLRIDESLFPPEAEITLPFDSIDIYIYQETHEFGLAVDTVLGVMNGNGFLTSIDSGVFPEASAAAAGLLAIPDIAALVELIDTFSSGDGGSSEFIPALVQTDPTFLQDIEGPIAIAAAGYLDEQILSTESTSLNVGELFGATGPITPFSSANSLIMCQLPAHMNVTSIVPNEVNKSYYDEESHMVMWNATALGTQSEYIINFVADFPPMISITRSFSPDSTVAGGSARITITVRNEGSDPITNLTITDDELADTYPTVIVTGTTSDTVASLAGDATATMVYDVTFVNEGGYRFAPVVISYEYEGETYYKDSPTEGYTVEPDIGNLFIQGLLSGMPYTGIAVGFVALVGIYALVGIVRSRGGGGGSYQV